MNKKKKEPPNPLKGEKRTLQNIAHFTLDKKMSDLEFRLYCLMAVRQFCLPEGEILTVDDLKAGFLILKNNHIVAAFDKFSEMGFMKSAE